MMIEERVMVLKSAWLVLAAFCLLHAEGLFAATECKTLEGSSQAVMADYLKGQRSDLEPGCMVFALERLEREAQTAALDLKDKTLIPLLVSLLDFRRTLSADFVARGRPSSVEYDFPAAGVLYALGRDAIPPVRRNPLAQVIMTELIRRIGDPDTSDLLKKTAIEFLLLLRRDDLSEITDALSAALGIMSVPTGCDPNNCRKLLGRSPGCVLIWLTHPPVMRQLRRCDRGANRRCIDAMVACRFACG